MHTMARIIVSGPTSGSRLSIVELIDGGLCKVQPQRGLAASQAGFLSSDGELYRSFQRQKIVKCMDLGTREVGGDSIGQFYRFNLLRRRGSHLSGSSGPMATNTAPVTRYGFVRITNLMELACTGF